MKIRILVIALLILAVAGCGPKSVDPAVIVQKEYVMTEPPSTLLKEYPLPSIPSGDSNVDISEYILRLHETVMNYIGQTREQKAFFAQERARIDKLNKDAKQRVDDKID